MRHRTNQRILAVLAALLITVGGAPAAAQAASATTAAPTATVAAITTGPWVNYDWGYTSYATCNARGAEVKRLYGGTHHGAVYSTRCIKGPVYNMCGSVIILQVKYVNRPNGPVSVDPLAVGTASSQRPLAATAAC